MVVCCCQYVLHCRQGYVQYLFYSNMKVQNVTWICTDTEKKYGNYVNMKWIISLNLWYSTVQNSCNLSILNIPSDLRPQCSAFTLTTKLFSFKYQSYFFWPCIVTDTIFNVQLLQQSHIKSKQSNSNEFMYQKSHNKRYYDKRYQHDFLTLSTIRPLLLSLRDANSIVLI